MMTKEEMILQLVLSLNRGNSGGGVYDRVRYAIDQYEELVKYGVIKEDKEC